MPKAIKLSQPIQAHGETVSELVFIEPKIKHLKAMDAHEGDMAKLAALIEELAGIPMSSVDEIAAADIAAIGEAIGDFLPGSQKTGEKPSLA